MGTNPHFQGRSRTVEAYVLGRDDLDLYDHHVGVEFAELIREQAAFDSLEALVEQMADDVRRAGEITAADPS